MRKLPDSLERQFEAAKRRLVIVETAVAALGGFCGLLFAYLLLFVSDRLWDTPVWLRYVSTATGVSGAALGALWWVSHYTRRRDPRQLALLVQRRFSRFGDRLLSVVELSDAGRLPENVSRELVDAAMAQVAAEAEKLNFREAVNTRGLRRWVPAFIVLAGAGVAALVVAPTAGRNTFVRWLKPSASVERFTFTRLEPIAAQRVVPYGEAFTMEARLAGDSERVPASGRARVERQAPIAAAERARAYAFPIPGQTRTGELAIAVGDARARVRLMPTLRPELLALSAGVALPEYLKNPPLTADVLKGALDVVEGSRVSFTGRVSRALAAVEVRSRAATNAAALQEATFVAPSLPSDATGTVAFAWKDVTGLECRQPFKVEVSAKPDALPTVDCPGLRRVTAILEDEALPVAIHAADDFGVKDIGVAWEYAASAEGPATGKGIEEVGTGGPLVRTIDAEYRLAPAVMGLGPGRIQIAATAADFCPDHPRSTSMVYTVVVLDKSEHARLVYRELERLQERLEDVVRAEEQQLDETRRLSDDPQKDARRRTEKIRDTKQAESDNRAALRRLREDFEKIARESLRNPTIDEKQIGEMAEATRQAKDVEQQEMQQAEQSLEQAAQSGGESEKESKEREEDLAKAREQQNKALDRLRAALGKLNKTSEDLLADNFLNRFRALSRSEADIMAAITNVLPRTVGQRIEDLPAEIRERVASQTGSQRQIQARTKSLSADMEYFLKRVEVPEVATVRAEMEQTNVVERLGEVAGLLAANKLVQGRDDAAKWSAQFMAWAEMLKKPAKSKGGEGQQMQQKEMSPEMMELILRLFRIRQREQDLRESTRALEARRWKDMMYAVRALMLAGKQEEIRKAFLAAPKEAGVSDEELGELQELMTAVETVMNEAEGELKKPETGQPAVGAETVVIELLSPQEMKMDPKTGKPQKSSPMSAQMMEMMRQMQQQMGMQSGKKPGPMGSMAGGDAAQGGGEAGGNAADGRGEREIEKAGGRDSATWPAEFRDAIEGYYDALEGTR